MRQFGPDGHALKALKISFQGVEMKTGQVHVFRLSSKVQDGQIRRFMGGARFARFVNASNRKTSIPAINAMNGLAAKLRSSLMPQASGSWRERFPSGGRRWPSTAMKKAVSNGCVPSANATTAPHAEPHCSEARRNAGPVRSQWPRSWTAPSDWFTGPCLIPALPRGAWTGPD
jgi:hypothetical protein